ncbi:MAG TPA: MBL fold metallo-hydrolase [Bryobacteraceae bacterium]|nr:MBL fold metallo-hydrolase [Bryobacteraceae bacterium]
MSHRHPHPHPHPHAPTRRDFFTSLFESLIAGAGLMEIAAHRAVWAQALSPSAPTSQFEISQVAENVYFALARPYAMANSNAAIFVNSASVVVVDAHSHPAAAAALIAQIKKEVTPRPVRYLIDTHFHFDHTQGNAAYLATGNKVDIVASNTTKTLMSKMLVPKLRAAMDPASPGPRGSEQVAHRLEDLRERLGKATAEDQKAQLRTQIGQVEAWAAEMKNFEPVLPTITFDKAYVIRDREQDLHLEFHGMGHTAGDIVVFCPQKKVLASGDIIHPGFPAFVDAYPQSWPKAIDSIAALGFDSIAGGHGRLQRDRRDMTGERNYIEELTARVLAGKKAGQSIEDLQRTVTVASLKSLHRDGYMDATPADAIVRGVAGNIHDMYDRVEKVRFTGEEAV